MRSSVLRNLPIAGRTVIISDEHYVTLNVLNVDVKLK